MDQLIVEIRQIIENIHRDKMIKGENRYVLVDGKIIDLVYEINVLRRVVERVADDYPDFGDLTDIEQKIDEIEQNMDAFTSDISEHETRITELETSGTGATQEQIDKINANAQDIQNHETRITNIETNGTNQEDIDILKRENKKVNINLMKEIANRQIADDALGYSYPAKKTADFTDLFVDTLGNNGNIEALTNCMYDPNLKTIRPMYTNTNRPQYYNNWKVDNSSVIITGTDDGFSYTVYLISYTGGNVYYKQKDTFGMVLGEGYITITGFENANATRNACFDNNNNSIMTLDEDANGKLKLGKINLNNNIYETYNIDTSSIDGLSTYCYMYQNKKDGKILIYTSSNELYKLLIIDTVNNTYTLSSKPPQGTNGYKITDDGVNCYFIDPYNGGDTVVKYNYTNNSWDVFSINKNNTNIDSNRKIVFYMNNRIHLIHGFGGEYNKAYYIDLNTLTLHENKDWILKSPHEFLNANHFAYRVSLNDFEKFNTVFFGRFNDNEFDYIHELRFTYPVWENENYDPNDPANQEGATIETKDMETSVALNEVYIYVTIYNNLYGYINGIYYSRDSGTTWSPLVNPEELIDISNQPSNQKIRIKIHLMHDAELVHYGLGGMP